MRFDLVDLQLFIAAAEARSITGGADRAHLALASASARIKGLEAALGAPLLRRGRRGIELTAAGESLLDHACAVGKMYLEYMPACLNIKTNRDCILVGNTCKIPGIPAVEAR
jgi:molybdenum-dependent DNA-binding transcriptional regulator ModE